MLVTATYGVGVALATGDGAGVSRTLEAEGKGVPAAAVERAVALSHDKYCSATAMLAKTAAVTTSFEVIEA